MGLQMFIKYALNEKNVLVSASEAIKEHQYTCIECGDSLIFRKGEINIEHFSHRNSNCNPESLLHKTAKLLIKETIDLNKEVVLLSNCETCNEIFDKKINTRLFNKASLEYRIGEFICDIVAFTNNEPRLGIEILATHKVDNFKSENLNLHWIELKATDVVENPQLWKPVNQKLKNISCNNCINYLNEVNELANKYNIDKNTFITKRDPNANKYIIDKKECYKCKNIIPVFWWRDVPFCKTEPRLPRPHTIKYKYSKTFGGSYWTNTCAKCGSIQGDNFLFLDKASPFKDLPNNAPQKSLNTDYMIKRFLGGIF